jgi:ABC-type lipoprotein release transport system permease subunit
MKKAINIIKIVPNIFKTIYTFLTFFVLLISFIISKVFVLLEKIPLIGLIFKVIDGLWSKKIAPIYNKITGKFEKTGKSDVRRSYLINLAYKNLMAKKTRSLITMFGMSIGVGIIVLLLSLGYGIEKLIISRVASLDELKMIDISAGENTSVRLNNEALKKISNINKVDKTIPLVSLVGKVNYRKATTDVLVYAAPKSYLNFSKLKLIKGKLFANNEEYSDYMRAWYKNPMGEVAGIETEFKDGIYNEMITNAKISFNILPETLALIWSDCDINSKPMGYARRVDGGYQGYEYWGGDYYPFLNKGREAYDKSQKKFLGRWIKAKMPLFNKDKDNNYIPVLDDNANQKWEFVCVQEKNTQIFENWGQVLGEATGSGLLAVNTSTTSADLTTSSTETASGSASIYDLATVSTSSAGIELISLQASESATKKSSQVLPFKEKPDGESVVSSGFLNLLSISQKEAIGTPFKVSFIIAKSLMPEIEGKVYTAEVEYKVTGIIDDAESSYFYIPFADVDKLGIKNFSQLKVVMKDKQYLAEVRKKVEAYGYKTSSTVDTIKQIESLFANLRIILAILGLVALGVASLGMFNTLTVSLLERTREIGGMKTMGMISHEVQDLFLAEAMVMGLGGGMGGLLLGFIVGKLMSLAVSIFAIAQGQGYLDLTYIPPEFTVFILVSSFVVGLVTGLYPAQRAKKISALNALRYE